MSFWDDVSDEIGKVAQGATDSLVDGPMGPMLRQELNASRGDEKRRFAQYSQLNASVSAWKDPLNDCGKQTSALLLQTSDYIHGLAVNYEQIIASNTLDVPGIRALAAGNVVQPLLNLPIPATIGGIPSAAMPGVEAVRILEGLVNSVYDSLTLPAQIDRVRRDVQQIQAAVQREEALARDLQELKDYLLVVANNVLDVFRRTTGIDLPRFSAATAAELRNVARQMLQTTTQLQNVKGNAFRVCRFIMNVAQKEKIGATPATDAQIKYIAVRLAGLDDIRDAFQTEANVELFVRSFFAGQLLTPGVLLHLPPVPANVKPYLTETAPSRREYSNVDDSAFDPPALDLADFPAAAGA